MDQYFSGSLKKVLFIYLIRITLYFVFKPHVRQINIYFLTNVMRYYVDSTNIILNMSVILSEQFTLAATNNGSEIIEKT